MRYSVGQDTGGRRFVDAIHLQSWTFLVVFTAFVVLAVALVLRPRTPSSVARAAPAVHHPRWLLVLLLAGSGVLPGCLTVKSGGEATGEPKVSVSAALNPNARCRRRAEVGGHGQGGPAVEVERRADHAPVAERQQIRQPAFLGPEYKFNRVRSLRRCLPDSVGTPGADVAKRLPRPVAIGMSRVVMAPALRGSVPSSLGGGLRCSPFRCDRPGRHPFPRADQEQESGGAFLVG